MLHITLLDNSRRMTVNIENEKTVGEALRENGFDTSIGMPMVNGTPVSFNDVIGDVCGDDSYVSLTAKANNALEVRNVGSCSYLKSDISKQVYDAVRKYRKEKLSLHDDKGNQLFTLAYNDGKPTIGNYAAEFSEVSKDGFLAMPLLKSKEHIIDELSGILLNIKAVETQVAAALESINADKQAVEAMFAEA